MNDWRVWLSAITSLVVLTRADAADLTTPVGAWDGFDRQVVQYVIAGKGLSTRKPKQYALDWSAQFFADRGFESEQWSGFKGGWAPASSNGKRYRVKFDVAKLNAALEGSSYLASIQSAFASVAAVRFGLKGNAKVTVTGAVLTRYADSGRFSDKSRAFLKGSRKTTFRVRYVHPKTQAAKVGTLTLVSDYLKRRASVPSDCCTSDDPAANLAGSQAFLAENGKLPYVKKTASGLQYFAIVQPDANGKAPTAADRVQVNYVGRLPNWMIFDRSRTSAGVTFPLSGVIAGWTEGLQLMKEGGTYRLFIPPELAYKDRPNGRFIKANSALVFDISLRKVNP